MNFRTLTFTSSFHKLCTYFSLCKIIVQNCQQNYSTIYNLFEEYKIEDVKDLLGEMRKIKNVIIIWSPVQF